MVTIVVALTVLTATLVSGATPSAAVTLSNLALSNASLENVSNSVPVGWTRSGLGRLSASWALVSGHTGAVAQRISVSSYGDGDRRLMSPEIPVSVGRQYQLSAWYRTDATTRVVTYTRDSSGVRRAWASSGILQKASGWTMAKYTTPAVPAGTVSVSFALSVSSNGTLITDDYAIDMVPLAPLLSVNFSRAPGLITNEYAYWNKSAPDRVDDPTWDMTSGSLFAHDSGNGNIAGFTGTPDDVAPDATSSTHTDSAIFRMVTKRKDFTSVDVALDLRHDGFVTTPSTPSVPWDGVHVFLRYQDETALYYASVDRRDNTVAVKKKVTGGASNGGTYYTLASGAHVVPVGMWEHVVASVWDAPDGSVRISLRVNGTVVVQAVDDGTYGAPYKSGGVGLRGDNSRFHFDNFVVTKRY